MGKSIDPAIKSQAFNLVAFHGKSYKEVAAALGVHETSVARWGKDGGWIELRELKEASSFTVEMYAIKQMARIYKQAEDDNRTLTGKEVDSLSKLNKQIQTLNKTLAGVSNGIAFLGRFMEYLQRKSPEAFEQIRDFAMDFTEEMARSVNL
jgi:transposase-like protein